MTSNQSDAVKRIAAAMKPAAPEKARFYEEVGRAIVQLSNAENSLVVIFCILSLPAPLERAKEIFAGEVTLERKLKLLDFLVQISGKPQEQKEWASIFKDLNNHRTVRNLIAHQRMLVEHSAEAAVFEVSLAPLFYKSNGRTLSIADVKKVADGLEEINSRLWGFVRGLNRAV
jgi:hypothetical protein